MGKNFKEDWAAVMKRRAERKAAEAKSGSTQTKPNVKVPDAFKAPGEKKGKKPSTPKKKEVPKKPAAKKAPSETAKPKAPSKAEIQAGKRNIKKMPVRGPKSGFRMTPAPTATERAQARNVGASLKAHIRANKPAEPPAPRAPKPKAPKASSRLATKVGERRAAKKAAKAAWQAKYKAKGPVGKVAMRTGRALGAAFKAGRLLGRASAVIGGPLGALDIGRHIYHRVKAERAHRGLIKQAGVLKDTGYRAKIRKPTFSAMMRGDIGLTVEKTGKPRKRTIGAAPPRLRRRR